MVGVKRLRLLLSLQQQYEWQSLLGDLDVCAELVRLGAAWVYDKYVVDLTLYDLQTEARAAERGIWSLPESQQIPPWLWRRR